MITTDKLQAYGKIMLAKQVDTVTINTVFSKSFNVFQNIIF